MTEENVESKDRFPWKRKKQHDPRECSIRECSNPAAGFVCSKRKGKTWWGPICAACCEKHSPHETPQSLEQVAMFRSGAKDVAKGLDLPVELVLELFKREGLDEKGRRPAGEARTGSSTAAAPQPETASAGANPATEVVAADDPRVEQATAVVAIPVEYLEQVGDGITAFEKEAKVFQIRDPSGLEVAKSLAQIAKAQNTELEDLRKTTVKPFDDAKKKVQEAFTPLIKRLGVLESSFKLAIMEAHARFQEQQDQALQEVHRAHQAGDGAGAALAVQQVQQLETQLPQGMSIRRDISFEVDNLEQVPREYFVLNDRMVIDALRAGTRIPGIRLVYKEVPVIRS